MKHYIYKTTNLINGKIYIGKRSHETPEKDKYLGSGNVLKQAISKYGKQNFKKEILYVFQNEDQAYEKQNQLVSIQFIKRDDVYNICTGGRGGRKGMVVVKTQSDKIIVIPNNNENYLNGTWVNIHKGKVVVKNKEGKILYVSIDDSRYLSGQLVHNTTGMIPVKDKYGNTFSVSRKDIRYLEKQVNPVTCQLISVKDKEGNTFKVHKTDPRWLSGQLVGVAKGNILQGHQLGQKNSQYGTIWVTNGIQNKKIKKEQNIPQGWRRGRKLK